MMGLTSTMDKNEKRCKLELNLRHNMKRFLLIINDILVLYLALVLALIIRYQGGFQEQLKFHLEPFSLLFILWLAVFYIANFYEIYFLKNGPEFYGSFFKMIITNAVLGIIFFYLLPWGIAPRRNLFLFIIIFAALNFVTRLLFNKAIASRKFKRPTIIVGLNEQSLELAQFLKTHPQWGYQLEYILDTVKQTPAEHSGFKIIHDIEDLKRKVAENQINTVVISPEGYKIPRLIETFYDLLSQKINFYSLSSFYEKVSHKVPLAHIDQAWFLENLSEGTKNFYEVLKRAADVVFAVIFGAVALILSPFIALAIKLSSPGPVLFRQTRVGQLGKAFKIIKFRTMVRDAEKNSGAVWAQENDPRITKIGRWLRRTRLDELPQLWNILKGEMSFVGPRAERPEFHEQLKKEIPFYEERYLIKPGLTGWAQARYGYGSSIQDAVEKLQYDLFYIKHRSLALDFSIILKTANIVLRQAGR